MWTATPRRRGLQGRKRLALHPSHHLSYLLGPDRTGTLGVTGTWTWDPGLGAWDTDSGSVCDSVSVNQELLVVISVRLRNADLHEQFCQPVGGASQFETYLGHKKGSYSAWLV